ncbi:hypothetical protein GCM10029978_092860 [Actinoallomurus acanthiterrae]
MPGIAGLYLIGWYPVPASGGVLSCHLRPAGRLIYASPKRGGPPEDAALPGARELGLSQGAQ